MAGELPTSVAGQTLNVPILAAPPMSAYDTTPALRALDEAFSKGVVSFDEIYDHFTKGKTDKLKRQLADEEMQNSADRMEVAPLKKKLTADQLQAAIDILPSDISTLKKNREVQSAQADSTLGDLKLKEDLRHQNVEIAKRKTTAELQGSRVLEAEGRDFEVADMEDPTGAQGLVNNVRDYKSIFGNSLPQLANGKGPDRPAMQRAVQEVQALKLRAATQKTLTEFEKKVIDEGARKNVLGKIQDKNGFLLPNAAQIVSEAPEPLTPLQHLEEQKALDVADTLVRNMEKAQELLKKSNVVGPVIGSAVNPLPMVEAVGGHPELRNAQTQLTMLVNELTAEKTRALKGALSEKELKFLQATVPKLDSDEVVWNQFLEERIPLLKKAIEKGRSALANGSASAPASPAAATPATPASSVTVKVGTVAEARRLRPGTPFVLPDGRGGVAH